MNQRFGTKNSASCDPKHPTNRHKMEGFRQSRDLPLPSVFGKVSQPPIAAGGTGQMQARAVAQRGRTSASLTKLVAGSDGRPKQEDKRWKAIKTVHSTPHQGNKAYHKQINTRICIYIYKSETCPQTKISTALQISVRRILKCKSFIKISGRMKNCHQTHTVTTVTTLIYTDPLVFCMFFCVWYDATVFDLYEERPRHYASQSPSFLAHLFPPKVATPMPCDADLGLIPSPNVIQSSTVAP